MNRPTAKSAVPAPVSFIATSMALVNHARQVPLRLT
jgi:hypothetical protein